MIGNVMVALMTALTVVTLMLYEPALKNFLTAGVADLFWGDFNPALMLYFLCAFAFILTWMREITKDMEDYKGDAEDGCDTMPIKWGLKKSILFIRLLGTVALIGISLSIVMGVLADKLIATNYAMTVYLSILFIAILAWLIFLGKKFTKQHFHKASTYLKLIMVLGIGSLIIYRLQYA